MKIVVALFFVVMASVSDSTEEDIPSPVELEEVEEDLGVMINNASAINGVVYTRWGRTVCPTDNLFIYRGTAVGSYYSSYGGGSNYLCLVTDPMWGLYNASVSKSVELYGAEFVNPTAFTSENADGINLNYQNVPCALCQSPRPATVMIPGRNLCYDGWTLEYAGYLVANSASSSSYQRTEFICVDQSPEVIPGGGTSESGADMYNVEVVCGTSIFCPPYVTGREITCVVCTK